MAQVVANFVYDGSRGPMSSEQSRNEKMRARDSLAVLLAYLVMAGLLFSPLLLHFTTHILADDAFITPGRSDAYNFLWTYWWIQKAARHFWDFYQCDWVLPPTGANLYFHTHVILPTLLTLPFGILFGPVGGYNSMVLLLLAGAASVYYAFLRNTFSLSRTASFVTGGLFGFCPYFVFKLHAHVNLVGAVFWAGALSLVLDAYVRERFGLVRGVLFGLCFWATFWTSFVELFALCIVLVLVVVGCEVGAAKKAGPVLRERLMFFAMLLPGTVSLASLNKAPGAETVEIALYRNLTWADALALPRLSIFGDELHASRFEYWGSHLPLVFVLLAFAGFPVAVRKLGRANATLLAALIAALLLLTFNPGNLPSALVRGLPMGAGFRVFGRFLPFLFFFVLVFAGFGVERVLRLERPVLRGALGLLMCLLILLELYPVHLTPSAVKRIPLPLSVQEDAQETFTWIVPRERYTNALDTYQVSMDVPVVQLSYLARKEQAAAIARMRAFPALYGEARMSAQVLSEMKRANVRYVLFEDASAYDASGFAGEKVAENEGALLVRYTTR